MPKLTVDGIEIELPNQVEVRLICTSGDAAAWPIQRLLKHFRSELERRINERAGGARMLEAAE